jgi:carbonic anhydrase
MYTMKSLLLSSLFVTLASAVCHHNTHLWAREEASAKPKFGYTGENGPVFWHTLDEEWEKCRSGKQQSPINIVPDAEYIETVKGGDLKFQLQEWPQGAELENLGTTIEVKDGTGSIERDGKEYKLVQFHFHTTSEHTLEEEVYALEVHFVFQAEGMYQQYSFPEAFYKRNGF